MLKRKLFTPLIKVIAAAGLVGALIALTPGVGSASTQAPAHITAQTHLSAPMAAPSNQCNHTTHSIPCWALTFHAGFLPVCANGVPLYNSNNTLARCLGGNDWVLIGCYYSGTTVNHDQYQDHVTEEDNGGTHITGHIPDYFIDLNGRNPGGITSPAIPHC
jgi:hypothetical protein